MVEITDPTQLEFAQAAGDSFVSNAEPFGSQLDFDRLGPVTGGRVIRGMNNIDKQIANSVDFGTNFYTIGYSPSNSNSAPRQYRNIRVVCLPTGLTVTTRNGYYTTPPGQSELKGNTHLRSQHGCAQFHSAHRVEGDRRVCSIKDGSSRHLCRPCGCLDSLLAFYKPRYKHHQGSGSCRWSVVER
jgi:hypothetical protein